MEQADLPDVIDASTNLLQTAFPFPKLAAQYQRLESDQYPFLLAIPAFWRIAEQHASHNLPPADFEDTGYVGREKDRTNLTQLLLGSHPVVTVTGEGGIGKTALTLWCLYDLVEREDCPFDAIVFASLKSNRLTPAGIEALVNTMATEVDVLQPVVEMFGPSNGATSRDELFDRVIEILDLFPVLVVIDNLETIDTDALRPLLMRIPRQSKVLLTSRVGLGEIEIRYPLEPLVTKDAVRLFRLVARLLNVQDLTRRSDDEIEKICARLFFNPLVIRWFVQGYSAGRSIPELLDSRRGFDSVLDFCFQNVYERLQPSHRELMQTLVIAPAPLSEVQLALLTGRSSIDEVRAGLMYLHSSNLIRRTIDDLSPNRDPTLWAPTEFARRYVNRHDNRPVNERNRVAQQYRALIATRDVARRTRATNAFRFSSIAAQTTDEATVVRALSTAQYEANRAKFDDALRHVDDAARLHPTFFEVWRVSAQIKDMAGDVGGAYEDFRRALELADPPSDPLLVFYAQFLRKHEDFDGALEVLASRAAESSAPAQLIADFAWLHVLAGHVPDGVRIFDSVLAKLSTLGGVERAHYLTQHASALQRAAELEIARRCFAEAGALALRSLHLLAETFPMVAADQRLVTQAQRCFQTVAFIVGLTCDETLWLAAVQYGRALARLFPLVETDRHGTDAVIAKCPIIAASEAFRSLVVGSEAPTPAGARRMRGVLKEVFPGRDYAFIASYDGKDYFVHRSQFDPAESWDDLSQRGASLVVEFVADAGVVAPGRSPRASAVRISETEGSGT